MPTQEELQAEVERLKAQNEELRKKDNKEVTLKVSQKGGVSVYGLGRFPVTLYREQWDKLLAEKDNILQFIDDNADQLKVKNG